MAASIVLHLYPQCQLSPGGVTTHCVVTSEKACLMQPFILKTCDSCPEYFTYSHISTKKVPKDLSLIIDGGQSVGPGPSSIL